MVNTRRSASTNDNNQLVCTNQGTMPPPLPLPPPPPLPPSSHNDNPILIRILGQKANMIVASLYHIHNPPQYAAPPPPPPLPPPSQSKLIEFLSICLPTLPSTTYQTDVLDWLHVVNQKLETFHCYDEEKDLHHNG